MNSEQLQRCCAQSTRGLLSRGSIILVLLATTIANAAAPESSRTSPNVVLILVDDLGWSDVGFMGSDFYETPNIDKLSLQSLRFDQAYAAAPVCSPTRAAIMTGKSPARLDMTIWHEGAVDGGPTDRILRNAEAVPNLPLEEVTLAELFHKAGYVTGHIGKWHLGKAAFYPETQGFDINVGGTFWGAPSTFFYPFAGKWNARDPQLRYVPGLGPGSNDASDYLPDRLTDKAIEFVKSNTSRPFFLNLWYYTVHSPIEAPANLVERFRAKKPGERHGEPRYAAMVNRMDHNVGRVLDTLNELGLSEDTIVIFTSDNGGVDFDQRSILPTSNAPLRSGKGTLYEGGLRVPLLIRGPEVHSGVTHEVCTSQDLFTTLARHLGEPDSVAAQDGADLSPLLANPKTQLPSRTLYWHFPHYYPRMTPGSALRDGDWKLIHYYEDDRTELYNLRSDPSESNDLANSQSAKAKELLANLNAWRQRVAANEPKRN